jgi:hypothetical protein
MFPIHYSSNILPFDAAYRYWQGRHINIINNNSLQFNSLFINVPNSTANGQLQSQHKHNNKIRQNGTKQQSKKQENKTSKSAKAI